MSSPLSHPVPSVRPRSSMPPEKAPPSRRTRQLSQLYGPGGQVTSVSDHQEHGFHRARYEDRRFNTSR